MGTSRKFKKKSRKRFFSKNRRSRSKYKKNRIFNKKSTRKIRRRRNIRGGGGIWELLWGPSEDEQAEREAALRKAEREAARLESEMERVNLEVKQQVEKKKRDALDALEKKRALNIKKLEMKAMERQREKDTAIKEELKELNIPSIEKPRYLPALTSAHKSSFSILIATAQAPSGALRLYKAVLSLALSSTIQDSVR